MLLITLFVCLQAKPTDARFTLSDSSEVMSFLRQLVTWGKTSENGWHAKQSCTGWALRASPPASSPFLPASRQPGHKAATEGFTHAHASDDATCLVHAYPSDSPSTSSSHAEAGEQGRQEPKQRVLTPPPSTAAVEEHQPARDTHGQPDPTNRLQPHTQTALHDAQTDRQHDSSSSTGQGNVAPASNTHTDGLQSSDFDRSAAQSQQGHSSSRTSLDHYLNAEPLSALQGSGATQDVVKHPAAAQRANPSGFALDKNGERLTALLLEKLHGHDTHAARLAETEEAASPPALTSNDSDSMAGYRSPFESLASYAMQDEGDSIHAEHGSAASLRVMPSIE